MSKPQHCGPPEHPRGASEAPSWAAPGRLLPPGSSPPHRPPPGAPRSHTLPHFGPVHSHIGASVPPKRTYPTPRRRPGSVCIPSGAGSTVFTIFPNAPVCNRGSRQGTFRPQERPWGQREALGSDGLDTPPGSLRLLQADGAVVLCAVGWLPRRWDGEPGAVTGTSRFCVETPQALSPSSHGSRGGGARPVDGTFRPGGDQALWATWPPLSLRNVRASVSCLILTATSSGRAR